jgi:soluble lytic murein transglycosylase-like protein
MLAPVRILAAAVLAVLPLVAQAQGIYKYVEKKGTIVYTNVPPVGVKAQRLRGTFHAAPTPVTPAPIQRISSAEFDAFIDAAARKFHIPEPLLRAVMHTESNFDPHAVSSKGACGLMQLMPGTAEEMYVKDIFDIRENIEGGARYLRTLANDFQGDMVKMVAAYNAGPDAVKKCGGNIPPFAETQSYVRRVIALYFQYKQQPRPPKTEPMK